MLLFRDSTGEEKGLAFIVDAAADTVPGEIGLAALRDLTYVANASGPRAFWILLARALADDTVDAIMVSLNSHCVLDDELPARLRQACHRAAGGADWAVLAATGKGADGNIYSVVYPSAGPRLFMCNIPRPIVDCGLELFVLNAAFLRSLAERYIDDNVPPECLAHWCILTGYLEGRLSVFRPEMAIGVDGSERGRDMAGVMSVLQGAFGDRLPDDVVPSLMGNIPIVPQEEKVSVDLERHQRDRRVPRSMTPLADLIRHALQPATTPMSLSVVTRTRFSRSHLLRRMLTSLTRARQQLDFALEVVLSTDVNEQEASAVHRTLQDDFPELELVLQINQGHYSHSRVDNLMGGILAARNDYIAIVDDDDFVDLNAFVPLTTARFLGQDPLLLMSSQVRNEVWRETSDGRWILESSKPKKTYWSGHFRQMFKGSNQLPVCAMIAPRAWMQSRLGEVTLRHDLSEDYAIYLALLTAPDLPPLFNYDDIFCMISARPDGSNTITMKDRRPWVRDITLFLHDLFIANPIPGSGVIQMLGQAEHAPRDASLRVVENTATVGTARQSREIAMLKAEVGYLRSMVASLEPVAGQEAKKGKAANQDKATNA